MRAARALVLLCAAAALAPRAAGYYLPGAYPREFRAGDAVQVEVNSLTSDETELPYDYYSLPFCTPLEGVRAAPRALNPGTLFSGARFHNSPYNFTVLTEAKTVSACPASGGFAPPLTEEAAATLANRISAKYRVRLILDSLPVTTYDVEAAAAAAGAADGSGTGSGAVLPGYELGSVDPATGQVAVNNHLMFKILVHRASGVSTAALLARGKAAVAGLKGGGDGVATPSDTFTIVGFEVLACSIARSPGDPMADTPCADSAGGAAPPPAVVQPGARIAYTYDVFWEESAIPWAARWDAYLRGAGGGAASVHWLSLANSAAVAVATAAVVGAVLARTVRRDLARYDAVLGALEDGDAKDGADEGGWKMVAGDAFRAPPRAAALAARAGAGVHVLSAAAVTLAAAAAGVLSPASRGALVTGLFASYLALAGVGGYAAVRVWSAATRSAAGWPRVAARAASHYAAPALATLAAVNVLLAHTGSSGAVPASAFASAVALWALVSVPLALAGGAAAARSPIPDPPTRTNQIPRHVPPPHWASSPAALLAAAGLLPFGTLAFELHVAMRALWSGHYYSAFGFAAAVAGLAVLLTAQVAVVTTYVQLCAEDYRWWWASFARGGAVAWYVAAYLVAYLFTSLHALADTVSVVLYLAYAGLAAAALHLACGTVGFFASRAFVWAIFAAVKAD